MLETFREKLRYLVRDATRAVERRRLKKYAEIEKIERQERKALVEGLAKKIDAARADCERGRKDSAVIELSVKEITFIEWNLKAWVRTIRESEIFEVSPQR